MRWEKKAIDRERAKEICAKYGCDMLTASVMLRRGIVTGEAAKFLFEDDLRHMRNPFDFPGMEDAVERILAAKDEGEKVLVFGDSDVDGITGTALLSQYLGEMGLDVSWRIPGGDDPYGLSMEAVESFAENYGTLIITVDCGISRIAEVRRAAELSVDVIVTDHHEPQEELPPALVILNPKLRDTTYPFKGLSGCAVAYKLACALRFAQKSDLYAQPVCLINTRPVNDAWIVEATRMRNLSVTATITETIVPGMVSIGETRLPEFLEGQQIFAWDAPQQKRALAKLFGAGVEIEMLDVAPEIGKEIPQIAGKSLLRVKELSTIAKYSDEQMSELDVFVNLFRSFIWKREKILSADENNDLQFAALGTIADIMPLRDENRIIVKAGLKSMAPDGESSSRGGGARPGIRELLEKLKLAGSHFDVKEISWRLCPTINAARRMGSPEKAANLFFEEDPVKRERLAQELMDLNAKRKLHEEEVLEKIENAARESFEAHDEKLVFVCGDEISRGVAGLVAQRLSRRFNAPAIAASCVGDTCSGSIRSARGYVIGGMLEQCADLFIDAGGHDFAGGFSLARENWDALAQRLKMVARGIEFPEDTEQSISIDAELPLDYLVPERLFKLIDQFAPYGSENAPLIFLSKNLLIEEINFIGKTEAKHLKMVLADGKHKWPALFWDAASKVVHREFGKGDRVDALFSISRDWYKGQATPQMMISDLKRSA
ncbi:MAG: single-stranded-DNA-specific exonuclease RecJ [Treponema sp.]|nr:single-stranded-DNA-specific exonuclease RecJ [Treponema sp.]